MTEKLFTIDQEDQICRFIQIIRENGGYGMVEIELVKGEVKFIALGKVSAKMNKELSVENSK